MANHINRKMREDYAREKPEGGKKYKRSLQEKLLKYERNAVGYQFIPLLMHTLKRYINGEKGFNESRLEYALKEIPQARSFLREVIKAHDSIPTEIKEKLFDKKYLSYDIRKPISGHAIEEVIKTSKKLEGKSVSLVASLFDVRKGKCCCDDDDEVEPAPPKNRYEVAFDHLYCVDESDPEWWGSDEPYMVFGMITEEMVLNGVAAIAKHTPEYGDVDDGDRRPNSGSENIRLYGFAGSAPIESNLLITGNCFEHDLGDISDTTDAIRTALTSVAGTAAGAGGLAGWIVAGAAVIAIGVSYLVDLWGADDPIGETQSIVLTQADADNYTSGSSTIVLPSMRFDGGDDAGIYEGFLTLRRS